MPEDFCLNIVQKEQQNAIVPSVWMGSGLRMRSTTSQVIDKEKYNGKAAEFKWDYDSFRPCVP
jgi:hypothetical protein